ncbi:MAG: transporter substrate-binding domain-containing protein [Lactobacillus sp.]|nr:transporter substrate-binding domain-containing protein [Lactobacillus sp.]
MKKLKFIPVILLALLFLTACSSKQSSSNEYQEIKASKKIYWGIRADVRLFGLMDIKSQKIQGFELDLAKALTKQMLGKDGKAVFVQTTAKTKIPMLMNHSIDVLLATNTITEQRKKVIDYTDPYFPAGQAIMAPVNSKIKSIKDLNHKGVNVIAVKGTTAVVNMKKFAPKAKVLEFDDYGQAFSALKAGQGVAMTTDNGILAGLISQSKGYKLVGGTFTDEPYGMGINKKQPQLRQALNKALAQLKKKGIYAKLEQKWFGNIKGLKL